VLEHGVGLADVWREHGDIAAAQLDAAGVGTFEAGDEPQQSRLARPRWTEQREELAFAHLEVDAVSRDDVPVALAQALQAQGQAFPPACHGALQGLCAQSREATTCSLFVYSSCD